MIGYDLLPYTEKKRYIGNKIKSVQKNSKGILDYDNYNFLNAINFPQVINPVPCCFVCDCKNFTCTYTYSYEDHYDLLYMNNFSQANISILNTCLKCTNLYTLPWSVSYSENLKSTLHYKSLDSALNHRELKPLTFYAGLFSDSILSIIPKDVILLIIYIYRDIRSL